MKDWNTPDHHIANTEHGTLNFTGDIQLVIADWQITENAPDHDGRIYTSLRGWLVNGGGSGSLDDPYTEPIEPGRAHLVHAKLRGREPLSALNVHLRYRFVSQPNPNTWDHRGCQVTVSWMDRRIDAHGCPIPEDEIGRTEWTNPNTGEDFDLTEAYTATGEHPNITWRHFDQWSSGVPLLHPFYGDNETPIDSGIPITDGEWMRLAETRRAATPN